MRAGRLNLMLPWPIDRGKLTARDAIQAIPAISLGRSSTNSKNSIPRMTDSEDWGGGSIRAASLAQIVQDRNPFKLELAASAPE